MSRPAPMAASARSSLALVVILLAQLMFVLDITVVNIALSQLQTSLGFSHTNLSWVMNAYTLTFGGLLLLGARAGDLYGRRRVFLSGLVLFTAASVGAGLATSSGMLLAARATQGVGAAFAAPSALALLMIGFAEGKERNRALGLYTALSMAGSAIGLILGGVLTEYFSWRWVFFINIPIGIALVALSGRALPAAGRARGGIDLPGAITSTLGMVALVFGLVRAASAGWGNQWAIAALGIGLVLLGFFVAVERKAAHPLTPMRLFASTDRVAAYVSRMLLMGGVMGVFFFLTQYLQDVRHFSAVRTGLAFLPFTATLCLVTEISTRRIIGRVHPRLLMVGGMSLSALALLLLGRLGQTSGYGQVVGSLIALAIGNGLALVPLTAAALSGVAPEDSGAGSGLINAAHQVGGSLGLAVLVTVFGFAERAQGAQGSPGHAFAYGADRAFILSGILVALAIVPAACIRARPGSGIDAAQGRKVALAEAT